MPTVRHHLSRNQHPQLTRHQLAVLLDQEPPEPTDGDTWWWIVEAGYDQPTLAYYSTFIKALWLRNEVALLAAWIVDNPGTRPSAWWGYSAPRLPTFWCGVPHRWITIEDLRTWPNLVAEPFDPSDPPRFEAEARYLERHGLFLPGERRRLRKVDFEPEAATLE